MKKVKHPLKLSHCVAFVLLCIAAVVSLLPLVFTFVNSFMGAGEIQKYYGDLVSGSGPNPFHLIPEQATLSGWYEMLLRRPDYLVKFWNSLLLCAVIVGGQVFFGTLGGYAFAKFRFPGRDLLFFLIIVLMMLPYQVTLVPNYLVLDTLNLLGGYPAIILPGFFSALSIFLMRQVIAGVPDASIEAAQLDGAGSFRILWQIVFPAAMPGVVSLILLSLIDNWNMIEQPLVFLSDSSLYPMSVFLTQINTSLPALGFACSVLSMLPTLLIFLFFEEELITGISYSALK